MDFDALVIGCGLTGSVIARKLAEQGKKVCIFERRNHIGGNMYDYVDQYGFLVQQYGPHAFHTTKKELYDFVCQYEEWQEYHLNCGANWDGKSTPTPFNFSTIDTFYDREKACILKKKIKARFGNRKTVTVVEALEEEDDDIREYAQFLFKKDYAPYTAKQWGMLPEKVAPSVLKRVPLRLSYEEGYFEDKYQIMPVHSYTDFFKNLLNHENIEICLNENALEHLKIQDNKLLWDGQEIVVPLIYTGALDELFDERYGKLPYRSLKFEWKYTDADSLQEYPIVAYPQELGYTRITEFKKLPNQVGIGSSYAVEYPLLYERDKSMEPYYPVLTEDSQKQYMLYEKLANSIPNLIICGRLADFKYYNMDQALERALEVSKNLQL